MEKPIFGAKGFQLGVERKYSDTLLMCLLQANKPDKYQYRRQVDHNVNGILKIEVVKFAENDDDSDSE